MYASLIMFVDFSSINLAPMMACILVAVALVLPMMGVTFIIDLIEEVYWVNKFGEKAPFFVLPPEIACLPLELDSSKELFCTVGGLAIEPEGSVPPVRSPVQKLELSITKSVEEMTSEEMVIALELALATWDQPKYENSLMIWS